MDADEETPITTENDPKPSGTDYGVGTLEESLHCAKVWNRLTSGERRKYRHMNSNYETDDEEISSMDISDEYDFDETVLESNDTKLQKPTCSKRKKHCTSRRTKPSIRPTRKRKRPCRIKRKKWVRPGPLTNNAYLNFVRSFRRKYCGLLPKQLVILAAYEWRCLSDDKKLRYRRQACQVTAAERFQRYCSCVAR